MRIVDRAREIAERRRDPVETLTLCEQALLTKMAEGFRVDADRHGQERYAAETNGAAEVNGALVASPDAATRLRFLGYIETRSNGQAWTYALTRDGRDAANRLRALMRAPHASSNQQ